MKRVGGRTTFNASLNGYLAQVVCVCPKCGGPVSITAKSDYAMPWRPCVVKLVCLACLHVESWPSRHWESDFDH